MDEDILKKYQETITLLQFRHPGYTFHGEFIHDSNGNVAFKLTYLNTLEMDGNRHIIFEYMDSPTKALKYFIYASQNRVFI